LTCAPLVFFDPQYRGVLDMLKYGNEGARQKGRFNLPAILLRWTDTYHLREAGKAGCREATPESHRARRVLHGPSQWHYRQKNLLAPGL
jgi:hypothetical protein